MNDLENNHLEKLLQYKSLKELVNNVIKLYHKDPDDPFVNNLPNLSIVQLEDLIINYHKYKYMYKKIKEIK